LFLWGRHEYLREKSLFPYSCLSLWKDGSLKNVVYIVIPAYAGIPNNHEMPAFAGMTTRLFSQEMAVEIFDGFVL
jgi:hypothetical protein